MRGQTNLLNIIESVALTDYEIHYANSRSSEEQKKTRFSAGVVNQLDGDVCGGVKSISCEVLV